MGIQSDQPKGILHFQLLVKQVFDAHKVPFYACLRDVCIAKTVEDLTATPIEEVFDGNKPNANNVPRAIALTDYFKDTNLFVPLVVVSYNYFNEPSAFGTTLIRENVLQGLRCGHVIQIKHRTDSDGYQGVLFPYGLPKSGVLDRL